MPFRMNPSFGFAETFKVEFFASCLQYKFSETEKTRIREDLTEQLKGVNFSGNKINDYKNFCEAIYTQKPRLNRENVEDPEIENPKYREYLEKVSGREDAKELLKYVKNIISTYSSNYHGNGPKDSFVKLSLNALDSEDIDKNSSDAIATSLTKILNSLQHQENKYYTKRVSSCFSCFTFFFRKRSSLQPLIDKARKLVDDYKKARAAEAKAREAKHKGDIPLKVILQTETDSELHCSTWRFIPNWVPAKSPHSSLNPQVRIKAPSPVKSSRNDMS